MTTSLRRISSARHAPLGAVYHATAMPRFRISRRDVGDFSTARAAIRRRAAAVKSSSRLHESMASSTAICSQVTQASYEDSRPLVTPISEMPSRYWARLACLIIFIFIFISSPRRRSARAPALSHGGISSHVGFHTLLLAGSLGCRDTALTSFPFLGFRAPASGHHPMMPRLGARRRRGAMRRRHVGSAMRH